MILRRYLIKEIIPPFALSFLFFSFLLSLGSLIKLTELFVSQKLSGILFLKFWMLGGITLLNYSLPLSILSASIFLFSRLSADYEIRAIATSGINIFTLLFPLFICGLFLSGLNFYFNNYLIPEAHFHQRVLISNLKVEKPSKILEEGVFIRDFPGIILFFKKACPVKKQDGVKGEVLEGITIYQIKGEKLTLIRANEGRVYAGKDGINLSLFNGFLQLSDLDSPSRYQRVDFKNYNLSFSQPTRKRLEKKVKEYALPELKKGILPKVKTRELKEEIHRRFSFSFSPFFFILIGIPLGIWLKQRGKMIDMGIASLSVLGYYLLFLGADTLGRDKSLFPFFIWLPNILFGLVGIYLLDKIRKGKHI